MIITIDGPAGSGKSTAARLLAQRLGVAYLDTGAMYRAVTLAAMEQGVDLDRAEALATLAQRCQIDLDPRPDGMRVTLDGRDVTEAIRANEVSRNARHAASNAGVRQELVTRQREIGRRWGDLVTEGRDQGSVVFPDAELKVYLEAGTTVRARRRQEELARRGQEVPLEQVVEEIERRDASDRSRAIGPLRVPDGAEVIDTSGMTIEQMVGAIEALARRRGHRGEGA